MFTELPKKNWKNIANPLTRTIFFLLTLTTLLIMHKIPVMKHAVTHTG